MFYIPENIISVSLVVSFGGFSGRCLTTDICALQYFEHVEEAVWAVEVLKATGKPVAACLCIGPQGDMHGISPGECAVRLVKAGGYSPFILQSITRLGPSEDHSVFQRNKILTGSYELILSSYDLSEACLQFHGRDFCSVCLTASKMQQGQGCTVEWVIQIPLTAQRCVSELDWSLSWARGCECERTRWFSL